MNLCVRERLFAHQNYKCLVVAESGDVLGGLPAAGLQERLPAGGGSDVQLRIISPQLEDVFMALLDVAPEPAENEPFDSLRVETEL